MKKIYFALISLLFFATTLVPAISSAAPLVTCGNTGQSRCTLNDLLGIPGLIISIIINDIVPGLGVLCIIIGGIVMLTSAGSPERSGLGKKILVTAIIGLVLALGARMLIDTILTSLGADRSVVP